MICGSHFQVFEAELLRSLFASLSTDLPITWQVNLVSDQVASTARVNQTNFRVLFYYLDAIYCVSQAILIRNIKHIQD